MRLSIRNQLLLPLAILLLGVVGMSAWTAYSSADRAWRQIEEQMNHVAETVNHVTFPRNVQTLRLIKGLSGAEYLLCRSSPLTPPSPADRVKGDAALAADESAVTTLPETPTALPKPAARGAAIRLGPRVDVAGRTYFCQGVYLGLDGLWSLYIFYPESLWQDVLWTAVRPSLFLGLFGGIASIVFAVGLAQRLSRRVQGLEQRTRQIAAGDFSPMPLPRRDDELRDLARSVNDMAERLARLQETVKQNERLRLLGQVSGGLAHQLRNGVAGARLAVQLHVRERFDDTDTESLQVALRQLAIVELNLKRFLDLGRLEELRLEACDLGILLDDTITLLRPKCRHTNIELQWQRPADHFPLHADRDQLQHVLLNILTNAIEAAGPGGRVRVTASQLFHPTRYEIDIRDSGPGPTVEVAERLFEPFVTGKREGVGLGLAVARQVVEAHQGTLRWTRCDGETSFVIQLPCGESGYGITRPAPFCSL